MKKLILSLVAVFTVMGLYAGETTVNSAEENMTDNARVTRFIVKGREDGSLEPTQRAKNLDQAVERWANGKASDADKELIKSEDGPFIKKLQDATVYGFDMDINNPIYHFLAGGSAVLPTVFSAVIDLYMIQHCTNDLSKITPEDFKNAGASREYGQLMHMKYGSMWTTKDAYKKYIQAVRAYNCADQKALRDYVGVEIVEATVITGYNHKVENPQPIEFSFKKENGIECRVFGNSLKFENGLMSVDIKKQKCKNGDESVVQGYVTTNVKESEESVNITFSALNVGDKVQITKTK